jgi:hypothetical protein
MEELFRQLVEVADLHVHINRFLAFVDFIPTNIQLAQRIICFNFFFNGKHK